MWRETCSGVAAAERQIAEGQQQVLLSHQLLVQGDHPALECCCAGCSGGNINVIRLALNYQQQDGPYAHTSLFSTCRQLADRRLLFPKPTTRPPTRCSQGIEHVARAVWLLSCVVVLLAVLRPVQITPSGQLHHSPTFCQYSPSGSLTQARGHSNSANKLPTSPHSSTAGCQHPRQAPVSPLPMSVS